MAVDSAAFGLEIRRRQMAEILRHTEPSERCNLFGRRCIIAVYGGTRFFHPQ